MKRSEIVSMIDEAGKMMDLFAGAEIRDRKTGEVKGDIPEGDIRGMQTALCFVKFILEGKYEPKNPSHLASDLVMYHGAVINDLEPGDEDGTDD